MGNLPWFSPMWGLVLPPSAFALVLIGRWVGRREHRRRPESFRTSTGALEAAVLGLMGLLLALTFTGATARFEARRGLLVEEANAIATTYLRLDLLPADALLGLRTTFHRYLDARMDVYRALPDLDATMHAVSAAQAIQIDIWRTVTALGDRVPPATMGQVLQPLNQMIDLANTRTAAFFAHPPLAIFLMLGVTVLTASLLAGYTLGGDEGMHWLHVGAFTILISAAVYLNLELEYPRAGLVRVDAMDVFLDEALDGLP